MHFQMKINSREGNGDDGDDGDDDCHNNLMELQLQ